MIQRHITIATHSGSPRTKRFVLGSLGIVLTVTATSGMSLAGRSAYNPPSATTRHQAGQSSPDVHNAASTTVSINGETIQVNGDGSYNRVYDSDITHVEVSVNNSSTTSSSTNRTETTMD